MELLYTYNICFEFQEEGILILLLQMLIEKDELQQEQEGVFINLHHLQESILIYSDFSTI